MDEIAWMRVGQLGRMLSFFQAACRARAPSWRGKSRRKTCSTCGPDFKTLLLLGRLRERNAESLFGAVADELTRAGITLLPATTYLEHLLAAPGHLAGPVAWQAGAARRGVRAFARPSRSARWTSGSRWSYGMARCWPSKPSRARMPRSGGGGALAGKRGGATLGKVSKPHQDLRFDVPVVGPRTLEAAAEAAARGDRGGGGPDPAARA